MKTKDRKYQIQIKNKFTKNKWYAGSSTFLYNQKRQADAFCKKLDGHKEHDEKGVEFITHARVIEVDSSKAPYNKLSCFTFNSIR